MKIVLVKKVENLGNPGDVKDVKPGYGRNFLLAKGLAVLPGDALSKDIAGEKSMQSSKRKQKEQDLLKLVKEASEKKYIFKVKADDRGKLYGSIGPKDIASSTGLPEKYFKNHYKKIGQYVQMADINGIRVQIKIEINKK